MAKIPSSILSVPAMLIHIIAIPLFFLGFVLLYDSRWIYEIITGGSMQYDQIVFNTLMLMSILSSCHRMASGGEIMRLRSFCSITATGSSIRVIRTGLR